MYHHSWLLWVSFHLFIFVMLALDLGVFHRKGHAVKVREALIWSAVWIALALIFNAGVWWFMGHEPALSFFAGYLLEKSLSVDNLFVFLLIFNYFQVPSSYQHKILFWGILGALIMRAIFIFAGIAIIQRFHWVVYILGAFLLFTGIRLFFEKDKDIEPEKNIVIRLVRRFFRLTPFFEGDRFFVRRDHKLWATPMFVVLLVVETTDVIFAVDSVPAILSITRDPFIVYSSNVFAILGLRSLYFALSGLMQMFHYLHYGLALILMFVGVKMLISEWLKIPIVYALGFIALTLLLSVLASLKWPHPEEFTESQAQPPQKME